MYTIMNSQKRWETEMDQMSWQPACDVLEEQDHYLLNLEMAGIPKDQINIEVLDRQLKVTGEKKSEAFGREDGVVYSERTFGKFQRNFTLPSGLDTERVVADYQDGVLQIKIPKAASAKPKQIRIGPGKEFVDGGLKS